MLIDGVNLIEVACVYRSPNSRWYSGAGIYRNVWFITRKDVCIAADGIYVSSEAGPDGMWTTYIDTEIDFSNAAEQDTYSIRYTLSDAENNTIQSCQRDIEWTKELNHNLINSDNKESGSDNSKHNDKYRYNYIDSNMDEEAADKTAGFCTVSDTIKLENPILWDVDNPYRYTLTVSLYQNNSTLETEKIKIGYKIAEFTPDEGFILNGRKLKLKGVCNHHDLGALGAAVNSCAIRRQITILKEMGVNAIRTAHNMAAPELIEAACDMGILINAESFDMWECSKTEYDYARFFKEWHGKDVKSWIRRDRNAPCVIMWSIGNEIYDTHKDEHGQDITRDLMSLVHKYDYRHNAPVTIGSNYMPWENAAKCADIVKLAGYNYSEAYYEPHHREHADWIIYGSETGSVVQSRGIYHFPENVPILYDDDLQCSSLGNSATSWGAMSIEACITDDRDAYYSAGMFIWSGFDYIGEPTPYHTKNSYFGQVDTAGFPKDSYYVYQSAWTDYRTSPMVHIYPYWDFNEGQMIDISVCSNAPEVELFLNDKSYGRQTIDHEHGKTFIARWKIPYQKGTLLACAYDEHGNVIARDEMASFGDAVKIVAHADRD
ncbi:MAG: glycoside hydrolase family 2 protein, partial [Lachnospiraceae bacterium]|nr:glycoside hydrolase family 2 protein [Lachnospiraceae bacterium]